MWLNVYACIYVYLYVYIYVCVYIYPIVSTPLESLTKHILIPNSCMKKKFNTYHRKRFSILIKEIQIKTQ